jgi:hypothetical protein
MKQALLDGIDQSQSTPFFLDYHDLNEIPLAKIESIK